MRIMNRISLRELETTMVESTMRIGKWMRMRGERESERQPWWSICPRLAWRVDK